MPAVLRIGSYKTGKTRRIGAECVGKCARILQLLEVATQPEEMNLAGYRFHRLHGGPQRRSVRVAQIVPVNPQAEVGA